MGGAYSIGKYKPCPVRIRIVCSGETILKGVVIVCAIDIALAIDRKWLYGRRWC